MARSQSIIVGGGIAATAPFTTGNIPVFVSVSPPAVSNSIMGQVLVGNLAIINTVLGDPNAAATETFRWRGGLISEGAGADSFIAGRGAVSVGVDGIAIGRGASASVSDAIAIGRGASVLSSSQVAIGLSASVTATGGVAIGPGATAGQNSTAINADATGTGGTAVGNGATANATNATAIGLNAVAGASSVAIGRGATTGSSGIAIGDTTNTNNTASTVIGGFNCATNAAGQILIGAGASPASINAAAGQSICIGGTSSIGAHTDNILIGAGGSSFAANTAQIGAPNTVINTLVVGRGNTHTAAVSLTIRGTNVVTTADTAGGDLTVIAPRGTGNAATGGEIIFQTGAPGASGATLQVATSQFKILKSAGGAGVPGVQFMNVTNGAGAAAGTLANAPSAGDPSFWLPVSIAGAGVRYIPCWT